MNPNTATFFGVHSQELVWRSANVLGLIANGISEKLVRFAIARCTVGGVEILPLPIRRYLVENRHLLQDL
jgi:hypothetical protein